MAKIGEMPSLSQLARHITALTLLASFAACSHGSEPRHPLAQQMRTAAEDGRAAPAADTSARSKQGVIRSSQAVPPPDLQAEMAPALAEEPAVTARAFRAVPKGVAGPDSDLADPMLADAAPTASGTAQSVTPKAAIAPQTVRVDAGKPDPASYWPLYVGGGIAALSLLALTLLRRSYRKAAHEQLLASEAHGQEILRERDAALAQAAEQEQMILRERDAARAQASEQERMRHADELVAQTERAAVAAAAALQERESQQAAELAAVRDREQKDIDPRIAAAHQLHDLLHRAERDVEPFLRMVDDVVPVDTASNEARQVLAAWHESLLGTRNRLSEALARHNVTADLQVVEPAVDLQSAVSRLIDHAARMSALMVTQQQPNSAILHWSRLLPGALIQLFWRAQTATYTSTMPQLPKVPDAPAPGAVAAPAPVPVREPARTQDRAIQQALRGVQRHAARA